ncbi:F-box/LRR-repeat protein 4-like isoform X1 [Littorina saxatilis]|uniref:F-box domain-containing protein n=1 Tax=Littorina saxatilis TaxID=31220 RepID=A0AAN9BPK0_9CAEN
MLKKFRKIFKTSHKTKMNKAEDQAGNDKLSKENGESCIVRIFGQDVTDFSSQYGAESRMTYAAQNLAGNYNIYPNYGDFTQACVFRTYGPWWRMAPSAFKPYRKTPTAVGFESEDYIEVLFEERLYPIAVQIYETYNPGAIVKIMASDYKAGTNVDTGKQSKWITLWSSPAVETEQRVRIFSPPIKKIDTRVNLIRLELNHSLLGYYTELDCIMLCGVRSRPQSTDYPNLRVQASQLDPPRTPREQAMPGFYAQEEEKMVKELGSLKLNDVYQCPEGGEGKQLFEMLPGEVIVMILAYLDFPSLARVAQTCRLLKEHAYDHILYLEMNLQPIWHMVSNTTLDGLSRRCQHLQRLNLSWCGKSGTIKGSAFKRFLSSCASSLVTLQLSCCSFINKDTMLHISRFCPQLKELDLSGCGDVDKMSALVLTPLTNLERLNLYRTKIDTITIIALIRSMPELQHLNLGSCKMITNIVEVVLQLRLNCPKLKSLDLWRAREMDDSVFQEFVAGCPLLEELDVGWCSDLRSVNGSFTCIAENCKNLKKLFLTANRTVCDNDLLSLAKHSRHLQQLDILGTREVSSKAVEQVLASCKEMVFFDVSFCAGVTDNDVALWKVKYPAVNIKKSFQNTS